MKKISQHEDLRTRKMVAGGIVLSKLQYLLPLFGAAPDYLLRGLQVQQMAAARAVVGQRCMRWNNSKILNYLGWLHVKQMYVSSLLILTHKIVTSGKPVNIYNSIVTNYPYRTRSAAGLELRAWVGTVRARERTAITLRTFKYQSIAYYNSIPVSLRTYSMDKFKGAAKKWARSNVT